VKKKNFYSQKKICLTGGAGFIGPHLLNELINLGAEVTVLDNLSKGKIENVFRVWKSQRLNFQKTAWGYRAENGQKFIFVDLKDYPQVLPAIRGSEIVFHLAAVHGGRGFITEHPADCAENFILNTNVIKASYQAGVDRIHFASSACIYPTNFQNKYQSKRLLKETDAWEKGWAEADEVYGWSKLMGELTLEAYCRQYGLKGSIGRYVTVYGPYQDESHAITSLIYRALRKEDPFVIWGSGRQDRDFTYVVDLVKGILAATEKLTKFEAVNLGTGHRYSLKEVVEMIFEIIGWQPKKIIFDRSRPEGVKSRALSIAKAKKLLGYKPSFSLKEGLEKTIASDLKEWKK
jgi:nucleoside-diphosphate-sugar epimerase